LRGVLAGHADGKVVVAVDDLEVLGQSGEERAEVE